MSRPRALAQRHYKFRVPFPRIRHRLDTVNPLRGRDANGVNERRLLASRSPCFHPFFPLPLSVLFPVSCSPFCVARQLQNPCPYVRFVGWRVGFRASWNRRARLGFRGRGAGEGPRMRCKMHEHNPLMQPDTSNADAPTPSLVSFTISRSRSSLANEPPINYLCFPHRDRSLAAVPSIRSVASFLKLPEFPGAPIS